MTDATFQGAPEDQAVSGGALYRLVWKWHFLAALFVLPFMAMLSITGGLYLFTPQIDNWLYADYANVTQGEVVLPLETQVAVVEAAYGLTKMRGITVDDDPTKATKIEFNNGDKVRSYAWVDPYTASVTGTVVRDKMAMRMVKKFHGELLLGKVGTKFVELAAHWTIVLMITGVYMWWPRGNRTLKSAVSLPKGEGRAWWRETHLYTGFLAAILITPILITGLPWTDIWGGGLSTIQKATGQSSQSLRFGGPPAKSTSSEGDTIPFYAVIDVAKEAGLVSPYEMRPAKGDDGAFWIRSASRNRHDQNELIVDQYSGDVLKRADFIDNSPLAKAVSYGISFHQGELYGTLNLIQNLLAAVLGFTLAVTGFVAWWKRRPAGSLGVPKSPSAALGSGLVVLIIVVSLFLPLVAASLIACLFLDWLIFARLGWFHGSK